MPRGCFVLVFVVVGIGCGGDDSAAGGAGSGQTAGSMTQSSGGSSGATSAGGAGGGNAAGSATAGGSAGAPAGSGGTNSGTDGGSMCTVMNPNGCDTCVFAKCCSAYDTCSNKDDDCGTAIGHLAECVAAADPGMTAACYDDFATTNDAAGALRTCIKTNCDAPCTTETP